MKNPKIKLRKQASNLFKQAILKINNGRCEVCGSEYNTTAHHFFPRSIAGHLVYEIKNGVCLCQSCHFSHHTKSDPRIHAAIIRQKGQKWYNSLKKRKEEKHYSYTTIGWFSENIERLKNI